MNKPPENSAYLLDKRSVKKSFDQAAPDYDETAVLQKEVGERLLERFDLIRISPEMIIDIGAGTGLFSTRLAQRYPQSCVLALDLSTAMLKLAVEINPGSAQDTNSRQIYTAGDAEALPVVDACADIVFSNLAIQWCNDLDQVFSEIRRILKPGGLLMFTTFGPDTLTELRYCWNNADHHTHINSFIDMHDIGDALIRAGLATPVMDSEHFTLTYPDARSIMKDLKTLGAHNVTAGRPRGLTGKDRFKTVIKTYETLRDDDGTLPCTYEVIYGHAWADDPIRQNKHSQTGSPDDSRNFRVDASRIMSYPDSKQ